MIFIFFVWTNKHEIWKNVESSFLFTSSVCQKMSFLPKMVNNVHIWVKMSFYEKIYTTFNKNSAFQRFCEEW